MIALESLSIASGVVVPLRKVTTASLMSCSGLIKIIVHFGE
jgi:hypothetical protein